MRSHAPTRSSCAHPGCGRRIWLVHGRWVHRASEEPEDGHQATTRRPGFTVSYGPSGDMVECTTCHKRTRMVPASGETVRAADVARYRRTHVCGSPGGGWDVEDREPAEEPAR